MSSLNFGQSLVGGENGDAFHSKITNTPDVVEVDGCLCAKLYAVVSGALNLIATPLHPSPKE